MTEYSDGVISLDDVPIVTPNFDVVVPSLSLKVHSFELTFKMFE